MNYLEITPVTPVKYWRQFAEPVIAWSPQVNWVTWKHYRYNMISQFWQNIESLGNNYESRKSKYLELCDVCNGMNGQLPLARLKFVVPVWDVDKVLRSEDVKLLLVTVKESRLIL